MEEVVLATVRAPAQNILLEQNAQMQLVEIIITQLKANVILLTPVLRLPQCLALTITNAPPMLALQPGAPTQITQIRVLLMPEMEPVQMAPVLPTQPQLQPLNKNK